MTIMIDHADALRTIQASLANLTEQVAKILADIEAKTAVTIPEAAATPAAPTAEDANTEPAGDDAAETAPAVDDIAPETDDRADLAASLDEVHAIDHVPTEPVGQASGDDLMLIRGLDAKAADLLIGLGVTRFADIMAFTPDDVFELSRMLGDKKRLSRENWIEQAAVLATGRRTAHASRAGFAAAIITHTSVDEGERIDVPAVPAEVATVVEDIPSEGTIALATEETSEFSSADFAAVILAAKLTAPAEPEAPAATLALQAAAAAAAASIPAVEQLPRASNVIQLPPLPARRGARRTGKLAALAACVALLAVGTAAYRTLDGAGFHGCKLLNTCGTHVAEVQE